MNDLFTIDWISVKSALVTVGIAIVLAVGGYIVGVGDVFKLDWHALVNVGVLSGVAGIISLAKSYMTDNNGRFLGGTQIK